MKISHRHILIALLLIVAIAVFLHLRLPDIPDADSFYHIKHSWLYRTEGLFQSAFPWTQYSTINTYSADIWYGLHVLLIPLTYFQNLIIGIKLGEFLITVASLLIVLLALSLLQIRWPIFWLFVFALASADLLYRLTMLRPHPLSLGLTLLLFAYLQSSSLKGSPTIGQSSNNSKIMLPLFLISAIFSWIHISMSWLPILLILINSGVRVLAKQTLQWKESLAMGAGLLVGWLMRPNPIGAAKLAYIQIAQLLLEKDLPLRFGRELTPFVWENFVDQLIPISILLLVSLGFFVFTLIKKRHWSITPSLRVPIWNSLVLWPILFYLAFATARRSNEIFIGFAIIFIGLIFSHYYNVAKKMRHNILGSPGSTTLTLIIAAALIFMPIKTIYRFDTYTAHAFSPQLFQQSSIWLRENAKPKDIVFNIHWDRFGQLFFWNHYNYYINGMDPIFQYAYSPELYWKTHFWAIGQATAFTCGQIRCTQEEVEDTYTVLKRDFKASYVIIEKMRSPGLYQYLEGADEFTRVFETDIEALYKIL